MLRDAVILAAGKGQRLRAAASDPPKPLHTVGGVMLIKRTLLTLARAGVTRVVVVTGFGAELVRNAVEVDGDYARAGVTVEFAHNAEFDKANGISVLVGGARLAGPFLLSMADHLYTPEIAACVGAQDLAAADLYLATDPRIDHVRDLDDATKVRSDKVHILEIGKTLSTYDRIDCGVFAVTHALLDALAAVRAETGDCSLTDGVRRLAQRGRARIADIGEDFWQDVDTSADREYAERALAAAHQR
jgi:1L-myo-inositol 1-phosphate cytidylyltransferase